MAKNKKCDLCNKLIATDSVFVDMCNQCAYYEDYISDETYLRPKPPNGLQRLRKITKENGK